jgi:hypothetical protein
MSNSQIASELEIADGTVKRHLANTYPKMGVKSRGEALRMALENEWFTIRELEAHELPRRVIPGNPYTAGRILMR